MAIPQAAGVASGVDELGRNGLIINKHFGARVHMPDPIMTDLPLVPDQPVDNGVEDFCKVCRKCANTGPTNSITFGDKVVHIGGQAQVQKGLFLTFVLSAWIRELGFRASVVPDMEAEALAAQAGLGTLNADGRLVLRFIIDDQVTLPPVGR